MERNKEDLFNRLKRIEGQVRGIYKMIEEDKYCVDIIHQIIAVRAALAKVGEAILESHVHGCVKDAIINEGGDEKIDELMTVIMKFVD
jgi:DNA-binding FrmR family transcriptional regulator